MVVLIIILFFLLGIIFNMPRPVLNSRPRGSPPRPTYLFGYPKRYLNIDILDLPTGYLIFTKIGLRDIVQDIFQGIFVVYVIQTTSESSAI